MHESIKYRVFVFLLLISCSVAGQCKNGVVEKEGACSRSDTTIKKIYLCFTAHDFVEGLPFIMKTLEQKKIKASFFLTGDFIRSHPSSTKNLYQSGHYVGAHSDKHLLYCDWKNRDSLLVSIASIKNDILNNLQALEHVGIPQQQASIFMPPFEWYNHEIATAIRSWGLTLINFTPGTSSNADYTTRAMANYMSTDSILNRIYRYEQTKPNGLNGFHLLIHVGTDPLRTDKLYHQLPALIQTLLQRGYVFDRW
jgi:peptidoglycan/xylan/chitin deacetylase (PgdA/CDA1 family)